MMQLSNNVIADEGPWLGKKKRVAGIIHVRGEVLTLIGPKVLGEKIAGHKKGEKRDTRWFYFSITPLWVKSCRGTNGNAALEMSETFVCPAQDGVSR